MARGTLYQLSTNMDCVFPVFDEDDFVDQVQTEAEYFQNQTEERSAQDIESFIRFLYGLGAETGIETIEGESVSWFRVSRESRRLYVNLPAQTLRLWTGLPVNLGRLASNHRHTGQSLVPQVRRQA